MSIDFMVPDVQKLPPLTNAQMLAGTLPGEKWAQISSCFTPGRSCK